MNEPEKNNFLEFTKESKIFLKEATKWAKFLAILGFIGVGFMIIVGLAFGSIMSTFNPALEDMPFPSFAFGFIYIIIAIVYFFPVLFLYRFVTYGQKALSSSDPGQLSEAFKNLKSHYQFIGILAIIFIGLYIIAGLVMLGVFVFLKQ